MGLNNFADKIKDSLKQTKAIVVDIYPHDSTLDNYQKITAMLLAKTANIYPGLDCQSIDGLYQKLRQENRRLTIVLDKIQQFVNTSLYMHFFESIYRNSSYITILVTNTPGWGKLQPSGLLTSCRRYIFPGFITTFDSYVKELELTFAWQISEDQISNYTVKPTLCHQSTN